MLAAVNATSAGRWRRMPATKLPAVALEAARARRVVHHRPAGAVDQAEMDVDAVADPHAGDDRREGDTAAHAPRDRARHLPQDHRLVGRRQARRGAMLISYWLRPYSGWISSTSMPA